MTYRKCRILNCFERHAVMHKFPSPKNFERFRQWLAATGNKEYLSVDYDKIFKHYRICRKHFAPEYLMKNNKVSSNSVPTLHLPELIEIPLPETTVINKPVRALHLPLPKAIIPSNPPESDPLAPDPLEVSVDMLDDTNVVVRAATREDMHGIYRLIKALAEFEKMEDQVKMTPEKLIEEGFDAACPSFSCFVAEVSGGPLIGYAIYYTCFSTWRGKSIFLEDLYVESRFRRCGIGKELMLAVAKVAYDTSKRLDFHVLKWNPAVKFYESLGAVDLSSSEQWGLFRLDETSLNNLFHNKI